MHTAWILIEMQDFNFDFNQTFDQISYGFEWNAVTSILKTMFTSKHAHNYYGTIG